MARQRLLRAGACHKHSSPRSFTPSPLPHTITPRAGPAPGSRRARLPHASFAPFYPHQAKLTTDLNQKFADFEAAVAKTRFFADNELSLG